MNWNRQTVMRDGGLRLDVLSDLSRKPELFEPGDGQLWTHPHIAEQMLAAHLDPNRAAASRPHEVIDRTVAWLVERLELDPGTSVLDLGCGPGLYSCRLASRGLDVTGIDYSAGSIEYARRTAHDSRPEIEYRCQNYLHLDDEGAFDVALLIYGDFCVWPYRDRDELLNRIHRALKPGGYFVFDVTTPTARTDLGAGRNWTGSDG